MLLTGIHFRAKDTQTESKNVGEKKIFHANGNDKKVEVAVLISDKINFKTKSITKGKEGHYIMIKGSVQEESMTLVNIYVPNTRAHKYIEQILTDIQGEIANTTIIVGNFNTHLYQWTDQPDRKSIRKQWSQITHWTSWI